MGQIKGVEDLGIFRVLGQPNLNIKVNRAKAARYGLNAGDLNTVVQTALGGTVATTVLEEDRQFNLTVRLLPEYRSNIDAVRNIKVGYQTSSGNAYIPLSEVADVSMDTGASYIFHERNQRYIPIKFSVRGRDLGSTVAEAQKRIAKNVKLPNGYRIEWAGEFEELQHAAKRLEVIVPISLILIMAMLYGLFNSLLDSLLVWPEYLLPSQAACCRSLSAASTSASPPLSVSYRFRGLGHEQHPNVNSLQSAQADPHHLEQHRSHVPCGARAYEADAHDGALSLHSLVARRPFHRHRQPGAASPGGRGRGGDAYRPCHVAADRTAAPVVFRRKEIALPRPENKVQAAI